MDIEKVKEGKRNWIKNHPDYFKERWVKYKDDKEFRKRRLKSHKSFRDKRRIQALDFYGKMCSCCREKQIDFLTIDHVNNDGVSHRKKIGTHIYEWLFNNKYPSGFQVLCMNCNFAKRFTGICPHQRSENY